MTIELLNQPLSETQADLEIVFVAGKNLEHRWVDDHATLELLKFKGESEQCAFIPQSRKIYIGVENLEAEEIRLACAKAYKTAAGTTAQSLKIGLYVGDTCERHNLKAAVEGFLLGSYKFDRYKSKKEEEEPSPEIEKIWLCNDEYDGKTIDFPAAQKAVAQAISLAESVNFVRDIVNTPPDDSTPVKLAEIATDLCKNSPHLSCEIHDEAYLRENNMNLFLAVNRASVHPPRLIHLTYRHPEPKAKIAIVGKGLTYDSGGLSLKPSSYMATMKADKSGGCAALGIIRAIAALELPFEVHSVIGATENMIGGNAYKPDDVIAARNGKTVEIKNTDAEGRLVLADCLDYAQDFAPDYIVDMATLTGACVVALGEYTLGVMGHSDSLKHKFLEAADISGELAAELPFNRYLKKLLKSEIADCSNISSGRYGGAITAGLFLSEFIREENRDKWVHLDIAGPAFVEKEWGYHPYGASGAGVRLVVKWLDRLARDGDHDNSCEGH